MPLAGPRLKMPHHADPAAEAPGGRENLCPWAAIEHGNKLEFRFILAKKNCHLMASPTRETR
jgi:hypothetical protein